MEHNVSEMRCKCRMQDLIWIHNANVSHPFSWIVIFFRIFGQSALISLCLVSPACKKNMLECFEMESLGDICIAIVVEGVILCLLFWFIVNIFIMEINSPAVGQTNG